MLIHAFVAKPSIEAFPSRRCRASPAGQRMKAFCDGFPGSMNRRSTLLSCDHLNMAFDVNSVPAYVTIAAGLPWQVWRRSRTIVTRAPGIECWMWMARHSRVKSSAIASNLKRRPSVSWSATKSIDQRSIGQDGSTMGIRPIARLLRFLRRQLKILQKTAQTSTATGCL